MNRKTKSQSQKLRAVLYLYYDQNKHKYKMTFEEFYFLKMEKLIEDIKKKLF